MELSEIAAIRRHIRQHDKLLINISVDIGGINRYHRSERWTDETAESIIYNGYTKGINWHDEIVYYGANTYVRLLGFQEAPQTGNLETSGTLCDYYSSDASKQFQAGMTKVSFAPIDTKMLIMIVPIVIGIILGMAYFMT